MTTKKKNEIVYKLWWGHRNLLILTAAASVGTFIMTILTYKSR